jgi:hypothetical protein
MQETVEIGQAEASAPQMGVHRPASARNGADQRRDERYAVHGDAEVLVTGGTLMFRGRILNISASGCYVQTVAWARLAPRTLVELVFVVKGNVVRARAEACYSESKVGLGLRFVAMEDSMRRRLDSVLAGLRGALVEQSGAARVHRSVLEVLTETVAARTDAVLKTESAERVDRHGFVDRPAAVTEAIGEQGDARLSEFEELGLAPEGVLGDADREAIAAMEAMEEMEGAAEGMGPTTGVREGVIEGVIERGP